MNLLKKIQVLMKKFLINSCTVAILISVHVQILLQNFRILSTPPVEKLKVCMYKNTGDHEAQMLAQIKSLPDGEMKSSLLEAYIKAVKTEQKGKVVICQKGNHSF
jgi:hypothetical protein